jgi:hypothetical protein
MTTLSPDDDNPRKGIAALTSLGKTKKKADHSSMTGSTIKEEATKNEKTGNPTVIAINDDRVPVDFNLPPRPTNDFPPSVLGPPPPPMKSTHAFDRTPKRSQGRHKIPPIPEEKPLTTEEQAAPKPKDYLMRSSMITERIRFEILLDTSEEVDIRTKALVIFGKIINVDPSRKVIAYHDEDEDLFPLLENSHDLPIPLDHMCKYISAPMLNLKAKKVQFHTRFRSVTSLLEMKRDQDFMSWLKTNKIYTSVMNLKTTENARAGFFLGKAPHLTNLAVFAEWVKKRVVEKNKSCPEFQINAEVIGRIKDQSTKCRAIVVTCSRDDVDNLKALLDSVFHSRSNFPFTPFRIMYTLNAKTQNALYKTHKSRIQGSDIMEIGIPEFYDLDTHPEKGEISLS